MNAFCRHEQVYATCIYIDLSKFFDKMDQAILVMVLADYGFGELSWIEYYMSNRQQWVRLL